MNGGAGRAEIIAIGTELLLGDTLDGNGAWLGRVLAGKGIFVQRRVVIGDDAVEIRDAVLASLQRVRLVICSGGLGPTRDDLTKSAAADVFGRDLVIDENWSRELIDRYAARGWVLSETSHAQALVPRGATVLPNPLGTAPGIWLEDERGIVILLPGVPHELRALTEQAVLPRLHERMGGTTRIMSRWLRATGIPESILGERIEDLVESLAPLTLAFLPSGEGVDLRVTSWDLSVAEAETRLAAAEVALRTRLGRFVYASGEENLAVAVSRELVTRGLTLVVAESCTGGLLAKRLTDAAGASAFFQEGFVTYANEAKQRTLRIDPDLIESNGAVSEAVVRAMAEGARSAAGTDCSLAITGVAGPDGGTPEKPVGTVWIAAAIHDRLESRRFAFIGDRPHIRERSAQSALWMLRDLLLGPDP